jgi:acetylornithine deacetylase
MNAVIIQERIRAWILQESSQIIAFLQTCIRAAALGERAVQEVLAREMLEHEWSVEWQSLAGTHWQDAPWFITDRKSNEWNQLCNLVGAKRGQGGERARSLMLNGHVDVVPVGDEKRWRFPPFEGTFDQGRIYGRGSCDMLGGLVAMWYAMQALEANRILLQGDVYFTAVVDEECGGAGTVALMLNGLRADAALIAEPSANQLFPIQQGSQWFRIHLQGKAAHGGTRYQGVSAIELAVDVVHALHELEMERHRRGFRAHIHAHDGIAYPINIGQLSAGNWPSSVPETAVLEGRYGLMPGQSMDEAIEEFEMCMANLSLRNAWFQKHPARVEWFGARWLPNELPVTHPWYQVWSDLPAREGRTIQAAPWGTDGGWLVALGQIPVMVYGPGRMEQAHQMDEWIGVQELLLSIEEMALAICAWCGISEDE